MKLRFAVMAIASLPVAACSAQSCIDGGLEMKPSFTVVAKLRDKPLPRATVRIDKYVPNQDSQVWLKGITSSAGTFRVVSLPPGDYWIHVEMLGVWVGGECFHIGSGFSLMAKRQLKYEWHYVNETSRVAGKLIDSQLGEGPTVMDKLRRKEVPIVNAKFRLQNIASEENFETRSDEDGSFAFGSISDGTYVLSVEGGRSTREFGSDQWGFKVDARSKRYSLHLTSSDPFGGSCGGTELKLKPE